MMGLFRRIRERIMQRREERQDRRDDRRDERIDRKEDRVQLREDRVELRKKRRQEMIKSLIFVGVLAAIAFGIYLAFPSLFAIFAPK